MTVGCLNIYLKTENQPQEEAHDSSTDNAIFLYKFCSLPKKRINLIYLFL